jgi:TolA-binding protein
MRKFVLSLAAAGAALALASPAAAQHYPQQSYGGYNSGYGYNNYSRQVQALQAHIDRVQWEINRLQRYHAIRGNTADRLQRESRDIERRLHSASRYGLNPYEANAIEARIARLEQRVQYASANRYGRYGQNGYGYNGYGSNAFNAGNSHYGDRDRDDDRYENHQGRDHDGYDNDRDDDHDD